MNFFELHGKDEYNNNYYILNPELLEPDYAHFFVPARHVFLEKTILQRLKKHIMQEHSDSWKLTLKRQKFHLVMKRYSWFK